MKITEKVKNLKNNLFYKTIFVSIFSLVINVAFIVYNAYLGIKFGDAFAISISIYYFLLIWLKFSTLLIEKNIANKEDIVKTKARIKNYKISSIFVFIIDLCLIAPIILMVTQPKRSKIWKYPSNCNGCILPL